MDVVFLAIPLDSNTIIRLVGTILICAFSGYTLGSIIVYFLTTNYRSKERNAIIMGVVSIALAVVVNVIFWVSYWQILWNVGVFLVGTFAGYFMANRSIMNLFFEAPLPEGLPIETDEEKSAVIILCKGEGEDYNPLPYIRNYRKNKELGIKQKGLLAQPFKLYRERKKFRQVMKQIETLKSEDIVENEPKNPYKNHVEAVIDKLEESFLKVDFYQEAFVNHWPTLSQALLRMISLGSNTVTILPLFIDDCYLFEVAKKDMTKIDFTELDISIKQADFLGSDLELSKIIAAKIEEKVPESMTKDQIGVILIADGRPEQYDAEYPLFSSKQSLMESTHKQLLTAGFEVKYIRKAWLQYRTPTLEEAIIDLQELGRKTIITVATTMPIDDINTLYEIPSVLKKFDNIDFHQVKGWNDDDKIVDYYLKLITNAKELDLVELAKDSEITIMSTQVGAQITSKEPEKTDQEEEQEEHETSEEELEEEEGN
jgi:protoheme ferro-lyase